MTPLPCRSRCMLPRDLRDDAWDCGGAHDATTSPSSVIPLRCPVRLSVTSGTVSVVASIAVGDVAASSAVVFPSPSHCGAGPGRTVDVTSILPRKPRTSQLRQREQTKHRRLTVSRTARSDLLVPRRATWRKTTVTTTVRLQLHCIVASVRESDRRIRDGQLSLATTSRPPPAVSRVHLSGRGRFNPVRIHGASALAASPDESA